jgi:SMC interacting uncharacterized protein involved in chromosome segregation
MTTSRSVRYQRLLDVLDKALVESRNQFDVEKAIKDRYGEGDDTTVFRTMLSGVLDSVHREVTADMANQLQESDVGNKLKRVEAVIQQLEEESARKKQADAADKESTLSSLQSAKLPKDLQPDDWIKYRVYQKMTAEKKAMTAELDMVESETAELEASRAKRSTEINTSLGKMQEFHKELEKSADLCSMVP